MQLDPEQVKQFIIEMLPMLAPAILEVVKQVAPQLLDKVPWFIKPIINAVIGALIAWLTEMSGGDANLTVVGANALFSPVAYRLARNKQPKRRM